MLINQLVYLIQQVYNNNMPLDLNEIILAAISFLTGLFGGVSLTIAINKNKNINKNKQTSKGDYSPNVNNQNKHG